MNIAARIALVCALAGCGRFGFGVGDSQDGGTPADDGGGGSADATDAATPCVPTSPQTLTSTSFVVGVGPGLGFASLGDGLIGAWNDTRDGGGDLYLGRFDAAGMPIGAPQRLTSDTAAVGSVRIIRIPTGYALTWASTNAFRIAILDESGLQGIAQPIRDMDYPLQVNRTALSFDIGGTIDVVSDDNHSGDLQLYLSRLDYTGARLGNDLQLSTPARAQLLAAAANTDTIAVAYYDANGFAQLARFDATGTLLGTRAITNMISGSVRMGLAWGGDRFVASWYDGTDINVRFFDAAGTPTAGPVSVYTAPNNQGADIGWLGGNFGSVWRDDGAAMTRFQRVDPDGNLVGASEAFAGNGNSFPLVLSLGSGAVAGWSTGTNQLAFQRVCP